MHRSKKECSLYGVVHLEKELQSVSAVPQLWMVPCTQGNVIHPAAMHWSDKLCLWTCADSSTLEMKTGLQKIKKSIEDVLCALQC